MLFLIASLALAEEPKVIYKDKTEIDFEETEIEGRVKKPQGQVVLERVAAEFSPLIILREDFFFEIHESVGEVK